MAKQKSDKPEKVIESVSFKNPNEVIDLPRKGLYVTAENLTVERYQKVVALSESFKDLFNVKLTNKQNEQSTEVDS